MRISALFLPALVAMAVPAAAQDLPTTGALGDMTIVGGALAQGQIAREQARKAGVADPFADADSAARARDTCAHRSLYRARLGAANAGVQKLYRLCAALKY